MTGQAYLSLSGENVSNKCMGYYLAFYLYGCYSLMILESLEHELMSHISCKFPHSRLRVLFIEMIQFNI